MHLRALQALFWRAVRTEPDVSDLAPHFAGSPGFPVNARLAVYRTAYWVRQVAVLRSLFPRVVARVGDGPFARTAARYLDARPSNASAIEYIGRGFPQWLSEESAADGQLAAYELAAWEVLVARDTACIPFDAARADGFAHATLVIGEHVQMVLAERSLLAELGGAPDGPRDGCLAVWREDFEVRRAEVGLVEATAVGAAKRGAPIAALCDQLAGGGDVAFVFAILSLWFRRGWVVALEREADR